MQAPLEKKEVHSQNLESKLQLGLNNRFGMMSTRLVEFQSGKKMEDPFSNCRADILGLRKTLRQELDLFRVCSPLSSGNISTATNPSYRSTSNCMDMGD